MFVPLVAWTGVKQFPSLGGDCLPYGYPFRDKLHLCQAGMALAFAVKLLVLFF